jgi:hypothetical protein
VEDAREDVEGRRDTGRLVLKPRGRREVVTGFQHLDIRLLQLLVLEQPLPKARVFLLLL